MFKASDLKAPRTTEDIWLEWEIDFNSRKQIEI